MKNFEYNDVTWYLPVTSGMIDTTIGLSLIFVCFVIWYMSNIK